MYNGRTGKNIACQNTNEQVKERRKKNNARSQLKMYVRKAKQKKMTWSKMCIILTCQPHFKRCFDGFLSLFWSSSSSSSQ